MMMELPAVLLSLVEGDCSPMTLTLGPVLRSAGADPGEALVIRTAYVREYEDTGMQASMPTPPTTRSCLS